MNLTPAELDLAAGALIEKAQDLAKVATSPNLKPADLAFIQERFVQHIALARKVDDEINGRNIAGMNLTVKLLQDLNLARGALDWHEDRTFTLTLADLQRLVDAARAA